MRKLINRLIDSLTAIPSDKWTHFTVSLLLTMLLSKLPLGPSPWNAIATGAVTLTLGLLKECYDEMYRGGWDWKEIGVDMLGCVVAIGLILL